MKMTRHTFLSALACLSLALAPVPALATVDQSHDYTMEAATPFVEQGFIVREDYWNGEVKSGQKLMISHQLFKGNEYAFWLGSVNDDVELDLKVYDEKGNAIQLDPKPGNHALSIRVNPQKTGTYKIVFSLKSKKEAALMWALAYGYR